MIFNQQQQQNIINKYKKFSYPTQPSTEKMRIFLSFIHEWKGLTKSSQIPKTKKEYLKKARNWLNGRRSKKYGNTLFFDIIQQCQRVRYFVNYRLCLL